MPLTSLSDHRTIEHYDPTRKSGNKLIVLAESYIYIRWNLRWKRLIIETVLCWWCVVLSFRIRHDVVLEVCVWLRKWNWKWWWIYRLCCWAWEKYIVRKKCYCWRYENVSGICHKMAQILSLWSLIAVINFTIFRGFRHCVWGRRWRWQTICSEGLFHLMDSGLGIICTVGVTLIHEICHSQYSKNAAALLYS